MKKDNAWNFPVWKKVGSALTNWRLLGALFVVTVVVALFVALSAADTAKLAAGNTRRQAIAQTRQTRVIEHAQCLRVNDVRRRIRAFNAETIRIVFTRYLESDDGLPPETAKMLDDIAIEVSDAGKQILSNTDCDKVSPLPKNTTGAERAQLPQSEPIDIPGDP